MAETRILQTVTTSTTDILHTNASAWSTKLCKLKRRLRTNTKNRRRFGKVLFRTIWIRHKICFFTLCSILLLLDCNHQTWSAPSQHQTGRLCMFANIHFVPSNWLILSGKHLTHNTFLSGPLNLPQGLRFFYLYICQWTIEFSYQSRRHVISPVIVPSSLGSNFVTVADWHAILPDGTYAKSQEELIGPTMPVSAYMINCAPLGPIELMMMVKGACESKATKKTNVMSRTSLECSITHSNKSEIKT